MLTIAIILIMVVLTVLAVLLGLACTPVILVILDVCVAIFCFTHGNIFLGIIFIGILFAIVKRKF